MSNALISLAAGFGGGYLQGRQRAEDQVRLDQDRAMRQQVHDAQMDEVNQAKDLRISLSNAAGPLKATEIIDVDPSNPGAPRKTSFSLSDGRTLGTREEVDKATADWNKPEARTIRLADAYRAKGKVTDAISLEDSFQERERKRKEFDQKQADEAAQRRIYGTRTPEELAGIVSDYPHDGHGGGLKARVVMSDDKKSWRVEATKPDGTIERWPGIYSNDAEGLTRAQAALYGTFNPAKKMEFFKWDTEQGRKAEKDAADGKYKAETLQVAKDNVEINRIRALRTGQGEGGVTKPPSGYRWSADGTRQEPIPGGPADKGGPGGGKALPISAANGMLTNQENLRRAQKALALVNGETVEGAEGDTNATGAKGWLPNQVLNRIDPAGVSTRAAIADLGSLVIHDRSGAAVTAAEFPRLAPFIPTEKDDAATVKKKLGMFTANYQALVDDSAEFYRESGYKVPIDKLKSGKGDAIAGRGTPATDSSGSNKSAIQMPAAKEALKAGTIYQTSRGPAKWNGTAFEAQ